MRLRRISGSIAVTAFLLAVTVLGCNLNDPGSPTAPASLTGNNTNESATFNGTLTMFGGGIVPADGATDALLVVEARDPQGNPVANGTPITVSTSLGTIRGTGADPATATSVASLIMFEGRAGFALRSQVAGDAVVTAWIADVAIQGILRFDATQTLTFVTLAVRTPSGDQPTYDTNAPTQLTMVANVADDTGQGLAGRRVRFSIAADSTSSSGYGAADFAAPRVSQTDSAGDAFTSLVVRGVGTVALLAELINTSGDVLALSNQAIVSTSSIGQSVVMTLTFATGSTVTSLTPPGSIGLIATVNDLRTGAALSGRRVRFRIESDTAEQERAVLANDLSSLTDASGKATNAVTVAEAGSTVVLYAELLSDSGAKEAESNEVVLTTGEAIEETITLTFPGATTVASITAPDTVGLNATVLDQLGRPLIGRSVQFVILSDTAVTTKAALASGVLNLTDAAGKATDAVTGFEAGSTVTIVVRLFDENGLLVKQSNQVVLAVE